ncbi:hypothetical protein L1987_31414 [Smallanthus sonchifolius]|uniref:Uncharacterized protein n=1 Tax=Smallanthus sonchifolius TaxID=185202 RepID=A0ACB9I5H5_9ASTR|nr:hypothetical protein L1987_31414 [Smallanthus sonchifolius]
MLSIASKKQQQLEAGKKRICPLSIPDCFSCECILRIPNLGSIDEEQWGLATWAQDSIKEGRLKQIVDSNLSGRISRKCLKEFALLADRCLHSRPKQRPTMAEVVVGLESILALQERTDSQLLSKDNRFFGRRVPTFLFPSNLENSVEGTSLKSLDAYLYTVVGENQILHRFDFTTIVYATENFSEANKLSRHTYGFVYKGKLPMHITITEYSDFGTGVYTHAYEGCMNEASVLVKFEHENMIQLLGYCIEGTKVYLLYDFASNATLKDLILDPILDWNRRYKIILGVARALVYLHNHAPIRIIHRDVTPANILLDESFHPKLSSFGIAMAVSNEEDCIDHDGLVCGTLGYIAPEYHQTSKLSTKADVYSFGVLVLETVTGQSAIDHTRADTRLASYAKRKWLEGTFSDIIDPRIDVDSILMTKFVEIGLLCVQDDASVRPKMEEVVDMLLGTSSLSFPVSEMRAKINGEPPHFDCKVHFLTYSEHVIVDQVFSWNQVPNQPTLAVNQGRSPEDIAPEYIQTSKLSTKADVYSFGVLVLETVTGQSVIDHTRADTRLASYAKRKWLEGTFPDIIDPRIDVYSILMTNLVEIGLLCVQTDASVRPKMEEVVDMLLGTSSPTLSVLEMRSRMNEES